MCVFVFFCHHTPVRRSQIIHVGTNGFTAMQKTFIRVVVFAKNISFRRYGYMYKRNQRNVGKTLMTLIFTILTQYSLFSSYGTFTYCIMLPVWQFVLCAHTVHLSVILIINIPHTYSLFDLKLILINSAK